MLTAGEERRYRTGESLAANVVLPGVTPAVADFFRQLES